MVTLVNDWGKRVLQLVGGCIKQLGVVVSGSYRDDICWECGEARVRVGILNIGKSLR